jgi:hypothetical protein
MKEVLRRLTQGDDAGKKIQLSGSREKFGNKVAVPEVDTVENADG